MKKAFTLAEVLITLGIIGVVVALTIPALATNYKRRVLEIQFRKAHSYLYQAIKLWKEDETDDLYSIYYSTGDKNGKALREAFYKYLKGGYYKLNVSESSLKDYYTSAKNSNLKAHYCPSSSCLHPVINSFVTLDGIMYNASARDGVINFLVDINGYDKGPNKWGIDLFDFDYDESNEFVPKYPCKGSPGVYCCAYTHKRTTNVNDGMMCTPCALKDKDYFKKIEL